jgi:AraC-like DNA-binding protein
MVDMRGGRPVRAGTYPFEGGDGVVSGWHSHDLHQLEYAFAGTVEVETRAGHYLLPPQQAVWIPAGLRHETTIRHRVKTVSVFFDPGYFPDPARFPGARHEARILAAAPVLREMILYATRWPIDRDGSDEVADGFFTTLAHLVGELLDRAAPLYLPTSTDPVVSAAMAYTDAHLATATAAVVSRSVGLSERSLRRRFGAVAGLSWRSYLLQSRLLRAMVLLAEPGPTVLDVATAVGFDSVSAFTRTFAHHVGETPTTYRRRAAATP